MRLEAGGLVIDRDRREVSVSGTAVHLSPKAYLLLEELMLAAPSAVSKEDLYRKLWGDTFVEEANIPNLVSEVRGAIGDDRTAPTYIRTVRGYGYLFLIEPQQRDATAASPFVLVWRSKSHPLQSGRNLVGRNAEAAVVIDWGGVSRNHAVITIDEKGCSIEDLGSKNGTYVGSARVHGSSSLCAGDTIRLGTVSLSFRRVSHAEETFTEAVTPSQSLEKP